MKEIEFFKFQASGNDFITIDNRLNLIDNSLVLAQSLCKRKYSVGADGLLLLEDSDIADIKMRILNPDGSEVNMCGNGLRCIVLFAQEIGLKQNKISVETKAGIMRCFIKSKNLIKTQFQSPEDLHLDFKLDLDNDIVFNANFINTGVEHVVILRKNIDNVDVYNIGRLIRYHVKFAPRGTNVNFVQVQDRNNIYIRTYERGVEDETLACGTGAVACSLITSFLNLTFSPVNVKTKGGEFLTVTFLKNNSEIKDLYIEGKAEKVFKGRYYYV